MPLGTSCVGRTLGGSARHIPLAVPLAIPFARFFEDSPPGYPAGCPQLRPCSEGDLLEVTASGLWLSRHDGCVPVDELLVEPIPTIEGCRQHILGAEPGAETDDALAFN